MSFALETSRLVGAGGLTLAYAALCGWAMWRHRAQQQADARRRGELQAAPDGALSWIVAHGSQTGNAEQLAWQAAQTLHLAGVSVQVCSLNDLQDEALAQASHLLLIASTYGEGDPPDNAAEFARRMAEALPTSTSTLAKLRYAVLALGDSSYDQFCGFGRQLDEWLRSRAATPLFDRIDADRMDEQAIGDWFEQVAHVVGAGEVPGWEAPTFSDWHLAARRLLNPDSPGEPVFHVELAPANGVLPAWEAGDLAQLLPPLPETHESGLSDRHPLVPRDYSIASIPEDGRLHLLIRLRRHPEGGPGRMSGWLGLRAAIGDVVQVRVRAHKTFRIADNQERPLILIGNGTGIAGLRAHIKARALNSRGRRQDGADTRPGRPCWLLFGERMPGVDLHYGDELATWQAQGVLTRIDAVFSRDVLKQQYVQHRLQEQGDLLREWVREGAAIYVCGSLSGMAAGVEETLRSLLGGDRLDAMSREGRYRRDVY